jgi:hypothetical protein
VGPPIEGAERAVEQARQGADVRWHRRLLSGNGTGAWRTAPAKGGRRLRGLFRVKTTPVSPPIKRASPGLFISGLGSFGVRGETALSGGTRSIYRQPGRCSGGLDSSLRVRMTGGACVWAAGIRLAWLSAGSWFWRARFFAAAQNDTRGVRVGGATESGARREHSLLSSPTGYRKIDGRSGLSPASFALGASC